ncbi:MAG: NAD(P)/FAD-dependent oxidoreductase [Hyphomonadaceae bacterium]|nr:NAD(P)/FAD-dependent oxidoreductase [Hyphomonadaceae bacterium]
MSTSSTDKNYDVAIVGGGHNGLAAACYLAADGKKVIVLERTEKLGGMAASDYLIPEAPNHLVHSCALELASWQGSPVGRDLKLAEHGLEVIPSEPAYAYLHDDGSSICFFKDIAKTCGEMAKYSKKDAQAYGQFIGDLFKMGATIGPMMGADPAKPGLKVIWATLMAARKFKSDRDEILNLMTNSALSIVEERFEHPAVQAAVLGFAGGAGPVMRDSAGLGFMLLVMLHSTGMGRVKGGMAKVPEAMKSRLSSLGGETMTNAQVDEIVAEKGAVRGVRLESGEFIGAKAVIGACHPKVALNLVTDGEVERKYLKRVDNTPCAQHGSSPFKIDIALNGKAVFEHHQKERKDDVNLGWPTTMMGSVETIVENFEAAARGELPEKAYCWWTVPSVADPSQAPEGEDILYVYPAAFPVRPRDGWKKARKPSVDLVMDWTRAVIPNVDKLEIGRRVETADQLEERLNVPGGSYVHVDVSILRSAMMRPAAGLSGELPVKGLFFGNAGAPPGGGVSGQPGRLAAARVKRFLK